MEAAKIPLTSPPEFLNFGAVVVVGGVACALAQGDAEVQRMLAWIKSAVQLGSDLS